MSKISGSRVLVTGGASGIGLCMVNELIQKGAKSVIIWDYNETLLNKVVSEFRENKLNVFGQVVDVSDREQIISGMNTLLQEHKGIDILINNAGIVVGKKFWEHSHDDIDRTMKINSSALMHLTLVALKQMIKDKKGHIVNIASAGSLVSNPKMSVYCGSKWAVAGWSDSVRLEVESDFDDIHVTTVLPYYINTGMFDGVKSPVIPILKPNYVSTQIIKAIEKNKVFLRMPFLINFVTLLKGLFPFRIFDFLAGNVFGIYKSMDDFKGRKKSSEAM
ncbi:MAG: SDR family oxidoreductase [Halobacteriovoraceae bacterium]|nr:SDR family oxidoreductase [Halobacteriovoraceae bacterium]